MQVKTKCYLQKERFTTLLKDDQPIPLCRIIHYQPALANIATTKGTIP